MRGGWLLLLVALALGAAPAAASGASRDLTATHAYIQATYAVARARVAQRHNVQARINAFRKTIAGRCPRAGSGSLQDEASQPVSYEVASALWAVDYSTFAAPIRSFFKAAGRWRWSNPAITRAARRFARNLMELATLPVPDLCSDVNSWKASGFQVIPPGAIALVHRVEEIQPLAVSPRLLARYESPPDASLLKRTIGLEKKLVEDEFVIGQTDWIEMLETLGLNE